MNIITAAIPIIRFAVKRAYSADEIRETIANRLNKAGAEVEETVEVAEASAPEPVSAAVPAAEEKQTQDSPKCPACGGEMLRRKASKGANAGNEFWGCSNYPRCKKIQPV